MKAQTTKSALLTSAMALLLCFAMLLGTTFAWFTDTASTAVNKIQAGTLDVDLVKANTDTSIVGQTLNFEKAAGATTGEQVLWEPGCTYKLPAIQVVNKGTLNLKYKLVINGIAGSAKLNEAIIWTMTVGGTEVAINGGTEFSLAAGNSSPEIVIKGHMKENAGNEYQNEKIEGVGITVIATQLGGNLNGVNGENDSFNNTYDQNALYPEAVVVLPSVQNAALTAVKDNAGATTAYSYENASGSVKVSVPANTNTSSAAPTVTIVPTDTPTSGSVSVDAGSEGRAAIAYQINMSENAIGSGDLATFDILVGKGLTNVKLYHRDDAMDRVNTMAELDAADEFYYNATTGFATFKVDHLSPFTAVYDTPAASIGATAYYDLQAAFNVGGEVVLLKNIETPKVTYKVTKDVTLNLNGKTLSGSGNDGTLYVTNGTLTINGDGKVIGNDDQNFGMAVWATGENSKVVINGGEYTNTLTHDDTQMDMIYISKGADAVINGGTFKCITPKWTLNIKDADANGSSTFTVNGGKFYQYNPASAATENPVANFVAAGKAVVVDGDYYTVTTLSKALAAGGTVKLASDVNVTEMIIVNNTVTLDMNGKKLYNENELWNDSTSAWSLISVRGENANLTVTGNGEFAARANDCFAIDLKDGAKCTIEDGKYNGNIHAVYVFEGALTVNGGSFTIQQKSTDKAKPYGFVLNCLDSSYANETATITVNGGEFYKYNPASSPSEAGTPNFLSAGFTTHLDGDWYKVVPATPAT